MARILVTGASGFIGRTLVTELANARQSVRAAMRQPADVFPRSVEVVAVSDLTRRVEWHALLRRDGGSPRYIAQQTEAGDCRTGVSPASIAWRPPNWQSADESSGLAALQSSCRRSVRRTRPSVPLGILRETDAPRPTDAYGRSKIAAEDAVRTAGVPFTILRPVLIYGPGVKGNFARLVELAREPWPLAAGSCGRRAEAGIVACPTGTDCTCRNRRSLVARQNVIDAIHLALASPAAKGETYIVADPTSRPCAPQGPSAVPKNGSSWGERWSPIPIKLMHAGWKPAPDTRAGFAALARATSTRIPAARPS